MAKRRGGAPWAVLGALILLLLAAVGVWFLFSDDDDVEVGIPDVPARNDTSPGTAASRENGDVGVGEILAGGQHVLPGGESQLNRFVNQPSEGRTVRVLSVPADEGFWVGTDTTNRVFVHLVLAPSESPFNVQAGETVSFTGTVEPLPL